MGNSKKNSALTEQTFDDLSRQPTDQSVRPYNPNSTQICTDRLYHFIREYDKTISLFFFTVMLAARADEVRRVAAQALQKAGEPPKPPASSASDRVQTYSTQLSRTLVTSMANNFLCYVSEILQDVVKKRHEILRSSEKLTTEEVLQFKRVSDIIAFIANRKINELSYGGLGQMRDYIADRLGVEMFKDDKERMLLTILVELRNIHTHNRGIVNDLFLNRVGCGQYDEFKFELGKLCHVTFDPFCRLSHNAIAVALRLDELLARKFKLKRSRYKKRLAAEKGKPAQ
jgi:hypothetical protein